MTGAAIALLLAVSSAFALPMLDEVSLGRAFDRLGAGELLATAESAYGRLSLGRSRRQYQLLADGRFDHSFPDPWERRPDIHLALVQHPHPERILLIGGGAPDRVEAALAHHPRRVVLTYLDELAHDLGRPYWPRSTVDALADTRVTVVRDDGRRFVGRTSERFDAVIVSARPPLSGQANRYHTREFFTAVRRVLRPGGSMTALAPGGANVLAPEAARGAASAVATVRSVFPEVVLVPGLQIRIHAAVDADVISDDPAILSSRFEQRAVRALGFSSRRIAHLFEPSRRSALADQIARWPAAINSDLEPQAYLANLQLWERGLTRAGETADATWTGLAERFAWLWLAAPLLLWGIWSGVRLVRRRRGPGGDAVFAIATTGAAGMAAEVVVLYAFQAASGRLYTGLALLVGLFMAGLAAGAFVGRRHLSGWPRAGGFTADAAALALMLTTGPVLSWAIDHPVVVASWSVVAGAVTGMAFPALLAVAARSREGDERRAAASIEAADHLGAALGALITGVIWLPVFGITTTCLLFAALKGASLLGLVPSLGGRRRIDPGTA